MRAKRARPMTAGLMAAAVLAGSLGTAQAANFFEKNFWLSGPNYSGVVPACDLPGALSRIQSHFATTESRFWDSSVTIDGFERVREIAFRPWGAEYQPRRYCEAVAILSGTEATGPHAVGHYTGGKVPGPVTVHGTRHKVYYSIIEDGGFIGASWGVEWCVEGFDRSWTYQPNCRMAQP